MWRPQEVYYTFNYTGVAADLYWDPSFGMSSLPPPPVVPGAPLAGAGGGLSTGAAIAIGVAGAAAAVVAAALMVRRHRRAAGAKGAYLPIAGAAPTKSFGALG